jgi:oxygen-independent coproporphyrinogen-3 oxidase
LAVLDRQHRAGRPEEAVAEARAAGFEHVNLDLIYGAPYESDEDWQRSVEAAIAAGPDHISAYALVIEAGTAMHRQVESGVLPPVDDDVAADRYVMADDLLTAAGFEWYEVSNWARTPSAACRHNELYWSDANWWGFGPGAHSHVSGVRWWNVKHPSRYTALLEAGTSPAAGRETLDPQARYTEKVMLGVRMRAGLATYELTDQARACLPQLASWGLIDRTAVHEGRVVLTQRGRLMADAVVRELLS